MCVCLPARRCERNWRSCSSNGNAECHPCRPAHTLSTYVGTRGTGADAIKCKQLAAHRFDPQQASLTEIVATAVQLAVMSDCAKQVQAARPNAQGRPSIGGRGLDWSNRESSNLTVRRACGHA